MLENDPNNPLDIQIDAALRTYAEPRGNPDARSIALKLLGRARAAEGRPNRPLWRWAISAAACFIAVAIAAAWLLRMPRIPQVARAPTMPRIIAKVNTPAAPDRPISISAMPRRLPHAASAKSQLPPKLEVFPTPTPLSPQERALVAFAEHGPPAVQRAVLDDQRNWDKSLDVAGLRKAQPEAGNQQDQ